MNYSTHSVLVILFLLYMSNGCIAPSDWTDEANESMNALANSINTAACLNLDRVDEINNRKNGTAQNALEAEEYAVYDYLIGPGNANRSLVVIYANTSSGLIHTSAVSSEGFNQSDLFMEMPSLELETLEDYEAKNTRIYPLQNLFKYNGTYVIVNDSEIYEVFSVEKTKMPWDEWEKFYNRCPQSACIRYFSRVGFNSNLDQALLEDDINCPYVLAGQGNLVLLEKKNGSWNVTDWMRLWVS